MAKHDKGEYDRYITDRPARYFVRVKSNPIEPIKVDFIRNSERLALNNTSEVHFNEHQRKAKWINSMMRQTGDDSYIDKLIMENEESFTIYFHKTNEEAKVKLATYDRRIVPFFESRERFELHCPREKYAFNKQFLLIKDLRCSHFFYCSWNWMAVKRRKGVPPIQCQRKECYEVFYRAQNSEPRKMLQKNILQIFKGLYHGQYYPTYPDRKIMVREPINITHLPSGTILNASIDNFRRGKFRSEYKNLILKELKKRFPVWNKNCRSKS
jgi:hypothetical protein